MCLARSRASLLTAAPDLLGTSVNFVDRDVRRVSVNDTSDPHTIHAGPSTVVFAYLSRSGVQGIARTLQACVDAGARVVTFLHHAALAGEAASRLGGMLRMVTCPQAIEDAHCRLRLASSPLHSPSCCTGGASCHHHHHHYRPQLAMLQGCCSPPLPAGPGRVSVPVVAIGDSEGSPPAIAGHRQVWCAHSDSESDTSDPCDRDAEVEGPPRGRGRDGEQHGHRDGTPGPQAASSCQQARRREVLARRCRCPSSASGPGDREGPVLRGHGHGASGRALAGEQVQRQRSPTRMNGPVTEVERAWQWRACAGSGSLVVGPSQRWALGSWPLVLVAPTAVVRGTGQSLRRPGGAGAGTSSFSCQRSPKGTGGGTGPWA